jgi:peptide/nickel transport system permease protein
MKLWPARPSRSPSPFGRFVVRRLLVAAALLLVVVTLVFVATEILPGDAVTARLGQAAVDQTTRDALTHQLGLDKPAHIRFIDWLAGVVRGDLGLSLISHTPVNDIIADRIGNSIVLAGTTFILLVPLAVALGAAAGAMESHRTDTAISTVSLVMTAVPEFVVAAVLIAVFSFGLHLLPPVSLAPAGGSVLDRPIILVLPVMSLLAVSLAWAVRLIRAGVAAAMKSQYVEMARLNGLSEWRVVVQHALPNGLPPGVQAMAGVAAYLIGGTVVVEAVFSYPGLGLTLVDAVVNRDLPVVQGIALLMAASTILIYLVADVVVLVLVPRLRTAL